jgi:hypothetical protein
VAVNVTSCRAHHTHLVAELRRTLLRMVEALIFQLEFVSNDAPVRADEPVFSRLQTEFGNERQPSVPIILSATPFPRPFGQNRHNR